MSFTMGSLFAGIGGFDLGFERAGFKTLWQVEIDPYAQKVLAKHFPEAKRYGDIRDCGRANLVPVDVICGGFPCQDISNAGLRAGMAGERSGLWGEMHRIIGELRPRFVLVENVAALLGRGIGRVLGDLAEIGYDAEWEVISAADVGAPHLRERVWIICYPSVEGLQDRTGETLGRSEAFAQPERSIGEMAYPIRERRCSGNYSREDAIHVDSRGEVVGAGSNREWWAVEPNVGRVANGVSRRVDRLKGLGNAVVPQIPEMFAHHIRRQLEGC